MDRINQALELYQSIGLTKQGAAMLIANFITESSLDPQGCRGDGGTACGLGQWRFGRRAGLPEGYTQQLRWAVEVEMVRDYGGHKLKQYLFDPAASPADILAGLKAWERWGIEGNRHAVGLGILSQIP